MQVAKGDRLARSPTAEEIRDLLKTLSDMVRGLPEDKWPHDWEPVWSLDNATVHTAAVQDWEECAAMGIIGRAVFVPPYSPDLHQLIEHAHANTVRHFKEKLVVRNQEPGGPYKTVADMFRDIKASFEEVNTPVAIAANLKKLLEVTYPAVIELEGGWPPASKR